MTRTQRQLLKLGLFIAWPVLFIASLAIVAAGFAVLWPVIPFARIHEDGDSIGLKLPWSQNEPSDP